MTIVAVTSPPDDSDPQRPLTAVDLERLREEIIAALRGTQAGRLPTPATGPIPFARFRDEQLALYKPPLRGQGTYFKVRRVLDLLEQLEVKTTADLTPALIGRFVESRPPEESPNTTYGLLAVIRAQCNHAVKNRYLDVSPFEVRKDWIRRTPPRLAKHHGAAEIARVLDLARADVARKPRGSWSQWRARRLYALIATVAYTGLRKMEAMRLRVEDIDLDGRTIHIRERRGSRLKTVGSAQPVPMADALAAILTEWLPYLAIPPELAGDALGTARGPMPAANPQGKRDAGWVFPNVYRTGPWIGGMKGYKPLDRLKILGRRTGVEGFTFLSLRHSWATHAESLWGFSEAMIQRVLRHTNTRTQWHYRHADAANLRAAVGGIGFGHEPVIPPQPQPQPSAPPRPAASAPASVPIPAPSKAHLGVVARPSKPKLDDADVAEMKRLRESGWSYKTLCARYGVCKSTLHYALTGKTHKQILGPSDARP